LAVEVEGVLITLHKTVSMEVLAVEVADTVQHMRLVQELNTKVMMEDTVHLLFILIIKVAEVEVKLNLELAVALQLASKSTVEMDSHLTLLERLDISEEEAEETVPTQVIIYMEVVVLAAEVVERQQIHLQ
jgi:hypothetical protein